jgi:hypothetical protein
MSTERGMTMTPSSVVHAAAENDRKPAKRKRLFWLGWVSGFAAVGVSSGAAALVISFLTACGAIHESQELGIAVSAILVGCLASFLLSAHGMDRLAAMRWENDR